MVTREEIADMLSRGNYVNVRHKLLYPKNDPSYRVRGGTHKEYCSKFNELCRENNRKKYNRLCWMCGRSEKDNGKRLSVHHIDLDKNQGCDGHEWRLIPLCKYCHSGAHTNLMCARIAYIYENE